MKAMKIKTYFLLLFLWGPILLSAQESEKVPPTFTVAVNQDNAFGFYPSVFGTFGVNDHLSFSYYGLFWTNPSFDVSGQASQFWTEMGVGLNFNVFNDHLNLNPSVGFTHGNLLSGGPTGVVGDGFVPSITGFLLDERFEAELFFAYYKALRKEGPITADYILYWAYPGIVLHPNVSIGFHYESFILTRTESNNTGVLYTWTGGYIKFTIKEKYALRISAGGNVAEALDFADEYYKMNLVIPLE